MLAQFRLEFAIFALTLLLVSLCTKQRAVMLVNAISLLIDSVPLSDTFIPKTAERSHTQTSP